MRKVTNLVRRLWLGEIPLTEAFWRYAVVYGLLLNLITSFLFLILLMNDASPFVLVPVFVLPTPYNFLIVVAVWRSAARYPGPRHWADYARAATVVWMIALTLAWSRRLLWSAQPAKLGSTSRNEAASSPSANKSEAAKAIKIANSPVR